MGLGTILIVGLETENPVECREYCEKQETSEKEVFFLYLGKGYDKAGRDRAI